MGWGGLQTPQDGEATPAPVSFQMENILLDERGKSLVALAWGRPIRGDTPSSGTPRPWVPTRCLAPQGTSSSPTSASPGTCGGASEPTPSAAPCSTWVRGQRGAAVGGTDPPGTHPLIPAAPEVLSGGPYSHTADWWSLGVLLFALASGEVRTTAGGLIWAPHGAPKSAPCPPSSLWHRQGTMWPCWSASRRAATRSHPRSAPHWPGCLPR